MYDVNRTLYVLRFLVDLSFFVLKSKALKVN
jgi:hypothetical protein